MGDKGETRGSAQMLEEAVGVATVTQGAREGAAEIRAQISPRPWALKNRERDKKAEGPFRGWPLASHQGDGVFFT